MLSHLLSIMITGCTNTICGLHFISNSFSKPILVLSRTWQISLDNLKNSGTRGSCMLTRICRLRLVGSRINCVKIFSFSIKSSNFKLYFVSEHSVEKSCKIFFLSTAKPGHVDITWQTVSSTPDSQILHLGEPPDWPVFYSVCEIISRQEL